MFGLKDFGLCIICSCMCGLLLFIMVKICSMFVVVSVSMVFFVVSGGASVDIVIDLILRDFVLVMSSKKCGCVRGALVKISCLYRCGSSVCMVVMSDFYVMGCMVVCYCGDVKWYSSGVCSKRFRCFLDLCIGGDHLRDGCDVNVRVSILVVVEWVVVVLGEVFVCEAFDGAEGVREWRVLCGVVVGDVVQFVGEYGEVLGLCLWVEVVEVVVYGFDDDVGVV